MPETPSLTIGTRRPNLNPTPKHRFRESGDNISKHRALLEQREFDRAIDFTMLEYQLQASARVQDANGALALGYKILGIQEFVSMLKTLSEIAPPPPRTADANLDHRA